MRTQSLQHPNFTVSQAVQPVAFEYRVGSLQDPLHDKEISILQALQQFWQEGHPLGRKVMLANDCEGLTQLCSHRRRCAEHQAGNQPLDLLLQNQLVNSVNYQGCTDQASSTSYRPCCRPVCEIVRLEAMLWIFLTPYLLSVSNIDLCILSWILHIQSC